MGSPLKSSQFVRLLDSRLRSVSENKYKELPSMIPKFYNMLPSDSAWGGCYGVGRYPDLHGVDGQISYLPLYAGYYTNIEPIEYTFGVQLESQLSVRKKNTVLEKRGRGLQAGVTSSR